MGKLFHRAATVAAAAVIGFAGYTAAPAAAAAATIKIAGSSTVAPITEAVAEEFQKEHQGMEVAMAVTGTGGGMKQFVKGEIDICNASRPIKQSEIDQAKEAGITFIEIPVAFDALSVVVNSSNDFIQQMTVADLKKIWEKSAQGQVTKWNQVNPSWPDATIKLYGPGMDSGTFEYFTEAVNGKAKESRGDFTASEDDNVLVQGVSGDKHALGYFGYAYYIENKDKLRAVPIVNKDGKAVTPSVEAVKDGSYNPLSRPLFIYVNAASMKKPEVQQFVSYYLETADELAKQAGYVPLPGDAYQKLAQRIGTGKTGTVFGGKEQVGITIEELLNKELKD
jgi:phosphate transport system substrate-binding protein